MENGSNSEQEASCKACKSPIATGATVCPVCKSYQAKWKQRLQYFATIGGLITISIAILSYLATTWPELRKVLFWRDRIALTSFDSMGGVLVFSNFGDGEVFVTHLYLHSDSPNFSRSWTVNTLVKPNSFASKELPKQQDEGWGTGPLSDKKWQEVLALVNEDCFKWVFFDVNNPHYLNLLNFCGDGFRKLTVTGSITFFSAHHERLINQEVTLYVVPMFRISDECKAKGLLGK